MTSSNHIADADAVDDAGAAAAGSGVGGSGSRATASADSFRSRSHGRGQSDRSRPRCHLSGTGMLLGRAASRQPCSVCLHLGNCYYLWFHWATWPVDYANCADTVGTFAVAVAGGRAIVAAIVVVVVVVGAAVDS